MKALLAILLTLGIGGGAILLFTQVLGKTKGKTSSGTKKAPAPKSQPAYNPNAPTDEVLSKGQYTPGTSKDPAVMQLVENADLNAQDITTGVPDQQRTWISSFYNTWSPYTSQLSDDETNTIWQYLVTKFKIGKEPKSSAYGKISKILDKYGIPKAGTAWD